MSQPRRPLPVLKQGSFLIDSHCHLDMPDYRNDRDDVLQRARDNGIAGVVTIGIDLASSRRAIELAKNNNMIKATVGVHPHDAKTGLQKDFSEIALLADHNRDLVVGFGEMGLDYVKMHAKPEIQRSVFRTQLALARELKLPIIVHDREAHEDCLDMIISAGPFDQGGIMHCFSGNLEFARKVIDCNLHISIPGIVTFKNAKDLQEVATHIPLNRLLLETDGPFLAPVPFRGRRNEPCYTLYTAAAIAELRQTTIEEIAGHTTANACNLFGCHFPAHGVESQNDQ